MSESQLVMAEAFASQYDGFGAPIITDMAAEIRRLRAMLIPMAEVLFQSSLRNGVEEYDEISVGRLNHVTRRTPRID